MSKAPRLPLTHARVLRLAIPIVLSNATVPILGAVDTGVVGQMGLAAPIGAVGIGAVILSAIYWIFGFLRMGTTGLAAQAHGAGDTGEVAALLTRALMIGFAAGAILIAVQSLVFAGAFRLSPATPEVEAMARAYMQIRIFSAPAAIGLYGITGWLIAAERTRAVLVMQLWMNGLNIALDLWFVLGLGWGVGGVAFATFLAEWTGLALGLYLCRAAFQVPAWRDWARVFDRIKLRRMAQVNSDILIRSVILQAMFVSFLFFGADFGNVPLAANQILLQFLQITAYALDGFAFAAEALIGQAIGARSVADTRASGRICMQWGIGGAVILAVTFALTGPAIIDLMTTSPDVREMARSYLPWLVVAPLIGVAAWVYDGIFIGALLTGDMLRAMLLTSVIYVLALLALVPVLGNHGLWAALMVMNGVRTLSLWRLYPKVLALAQSR